MIDNEAFFTTTPIARDVLPLAVCSAQGADESRYSDLFQIAVVQSGIQDLVFLASDCARGRDESICFLQSADWVRNARIGERAITIDDAGKDLKLEWLAGPEVGAYVNAVEIIGREHVEAILKMYSER